MSKNYNNMYLKNKHTLLQIFIIKYKVSPKNNANETYTKGCVRSIT